MPKWKLEAHKDLYMVNPPEDWPTVTQTNRSINRTDTHSIDVPLQEVQTLLRDHYRIPSNNIQIEIVDKAQSIRLTWSENKHHPVEEFKR